jgi:SAM-dependent methyltransferase
MRDRSRFALQDAEYAFPYHHIPYLAPNGAARISRYVGWGRQYLAYMSLVAARIAEGNPASILDIGCGDGRLLASLGDTISRKVGIDLSERAIAFARAFAPNVEWVCGDVADLPDEFECVSLIEVLEHIPDEAMQDFLDTAISKLATGGLLVVTVPTTKLKVTPKHYRHYDKPLLMTQLALEKRGLSEVETVYLSHYSPFFEFILRLLCNKHWEIRNAVIERWVWSYVSSSLVVSDERHGQQLLMLLRKL